jgi:hypothetical protein
MVLRLDTWPARIFVGVALILGFIKMLAALAGYGDLRLLNAANTALLVAACGVAIVAIAQRLQDIGQDIGALLSRQAIDKTQLAEAYETQLQAIARGLFGTNGVETKTRRHRFNPYPNCFVGSEAVTWLVRHQNCTRVSATQLGQALLDRGYIRHITGERPFEDDYALYQFNPQQFMNQRQLQEAGVQVTTAATVSESDSEPKSEPGSEPNSESSSKSTSDTKTTQPT